MFNFEQQMNQTKQQAVAAGFSGTAIIDVHPSRGYLRLKLKLSQPDKLSEFMNTYAGVIGMTLGAMNVESKIHISEETTS